MSAMRTTEKDNRHRYACNRYSKPFGFLGSFAVGGRQDFNQPTSFEAPFKN